MTTGGVSSLYFLFQRLHDKEYMLNISKLTIWNFILTCGTVLERVGPHQFGTFTFNCLAIYRIHFCKEGFQNNF